MSVFKFKEFNIEHDRTAMKVGTDGVLLGAWVVANSGSINILDVGTGTGVIALMLAQKLNYAKIDAIEIDEGAFQQAIVNVHNSPWFDRIRVFKLSLNEFILTHKKDYEMIVCNPPYFLKGYKVDDPQRKFARDAAYLPHEQLILVARERMKVDGSLNLILPIKEGQQFIIKAEKAGLYCKRLTFVQTKEYLEPKRILLEMVKFKSDTNKSNLVIEHAGDNNYTDQYKQLTQDFYLNF